MDLYDSFFSFWYDRNSDNPEDLYSLKEATNMNAIQVKIGKLGERTIEVTLAEGSTVQDALNASGVETAGYGLRVDGESVTATEVVNDGEIVQLLPNVKGG